VILPGLLDVSGRSRRNAYRAMREMGRQRAEVDEAVRTFDAARSHRDLPVERAAGRSASAGRRRT
jgi:hypothetical protein